MGILRCEFTSFARRGLLRPPRLYSFGRLRLSGNESPCGRAIIVARSRWRLVWLRLVGRRGAQPLGRVRLALSVGTIVISQSARKLYLVVDEREAIAYPVAVAKRGKEWSGYARVDGKYVEPGMVAARSRSNATIPNCPT